MANIKVNIEAEVNDEVLSKILEGINVSQVGEATTKAPLKVPRVIQVEISDVGGKLTARILTEEEEEEETKEKEEK